MSERANLNLASVKGKTIVIKYGGNALAFGAHSEHIFEEIALLQKFGARVLLVHGGGPQISQALCRMGIESRHYNGLRIADEETVNVAEMVLCGQISKRLVSLLHQFDVKALSVSGKDLQLFGVKPLENMEVDLGYFGEIDYIHTQEFQLLTNQAWIPVVAPIGLGADGATYMLDADHLAARLAATLNADKLFILTNVQGVFAMQNRPESLLSKITYTMALELLNSGQISGGMIPKLTSCIEAVQAGVKAVHIFNSEVSGAVLENACADGFVGTCISNA